jgi:hypothetical protein
MVASLEASAALAQMATISQRLSSLRCRARRRDTCPCEWQATDKRLITAKGGRRRLRLMRKVLADRLAPPSTPPPGRDQPSVRQDFPRIRRWPADINVS